MTADRFESRVADWLEDGPDVAPAGLAEKAIQHAEAHPRSGISRIARRIRRRAPVLAVAAVAVALVGAGVGGLQRFRLPATSAGPVALTGTESCATRVNGATLYVNDTTNEVRGRIDICQDVMSDPRVSGEQTRQVSAWLIAAGPDAPDGSSTFYGTLSIASDGGRWDGAFVATYDGLAITMPGRLTWTALGSGGYDGLVYRATLVVDEQQVATLTGSIESVGGDAVIASTWCWVTRATPDLTDGVVPHRDAYRDCTVTSTDDRLNGMASEERIIDRADDGTATDTGRLNVTTATGEWSGAFSGTGDWYVTGRVTGTLQGFGAHEGLSLPFEIVSEDGMHGVLLGTISRNR